MILGLYYTLIIGLSCSELLNPHSVPLSNDNIPLVSEFEKKRGAIPRLMSGATQRQFDDQARDRDLIVYYSFDKQKHKSAKVKDESGHDNNGIVDIGGMFIEIPESTCKVAAYLWDQTLKINFAAQDGVPKNGISLALWIQMLTTNGERTVFQAQGRRFGIMTIKFYGKTVFFSHRQCNACTDNFTLVAETNITDDWFHLAASYNATNGIAQLYINGSPVNRTWNKDFHPFQYWGNNVKVGGNHCHSSLHGFIDELKIYNYALSAQEVSFLALTCCFSGCNALSPNGSISSFAYNYYDQFDRRDLISDKEPYPDYIDP